MFARTWIRRTPCVPVLVLAFLANGPSTAVGQPKKTAPAKAGVTSPVTPAPSSEPVTPSTQPDSANLTPGYTLKPADVTLPAGVPIGKYRRSFQPFPNWTLICDEDFSKKQKVCNIAQTILGPTGSAVFSWSLAAAQDGQPIFILRAPPSIGEQGTIRLTLPDAARPLQVSVQGCNPVTCLAYQPVGQRLRTAVEKEQVVDISYVAGSPPQTLNFRAPLAGLAKALAAI